MWLAPFRVPHTLLDSLRTASRARREIPGNIWVWSSRLRFRQFHSPSNRLIVADRRYTPIAARMTLGKIGANDSLHAPTRANMRRALSAQGDLERMEHPKSASGSGHKLPSTSSARNKADRKKSDSTRPLRKETGSKSKSKKLVCRYCGSDDLAPSFIKRRDRRCRKCFSKRYRSAARARKPKVKK